MVGFVKTEHQGRLEHCSSVATSQNGSVGASNVTHFQSMAAVQDPVSHSMLNGNGGRPSPGPFYGAYGAHGFGAAPAGQANGHSMQYGDPSGHYAPYQNVMGYETSSPSLPQPPQPQQGAAGGEDGNGGIGGVRVDGGSGGGHLTPTPHHGQWSYSHHPHHSRMALEEWGQHYMQLQPAPHHHPSSDNNNGGTPPLLHPHQQHYNNSYPYGRMQLDGFDPQGHGLETSSSSGETGDSPQGGQGGGSGTKQLRPPFEWMKPANVLPAPGKTRTKDKYRVVYSDHQRLELEKEFHFSRYITIRRKAEIAQQLNLSERQVKIWFQNRRAKERKQNKKRDELRGPGTNNNVPKLEPLDSPPPINGQHHPQGPALSPNMGIGMNPHAMMSQSAAGNGGMGIPASMMSSMAQQQRFQNGAMQGLPQRMSPASQGMAVPHEGHATLPHTATPTIQVSANGNHPHNVNLQLHPSQAILPVVKPSFSEEEA